MLYELRLIAELMKQNDRLRADLKAVAKAVDFFLEDGVAEDSPDLNQYAYQRLVELLDLPSIKEILENE